MHLKLEERYNPKAIEGKWQQIWDKQKTFKAPNPAQDPKKRKKFYALSMFPYPSGAIHMGHLRNYTICDIIARYKRMQGFNVLQPPGWDAFGLPAENAAIQRGVHPGTWTAENISQMRQELKRMGIAYDWDREVTTCDPKYYRWEQLFFTRLYKEGLAYKKTGKVNWCEKCQTVLANEQVQDGKCWRCDGEANLKELNQWYFKITVYADQLLEGHKLLSGKWPERVLEMQRNWIGKSQGCRIKFKVDKKADLIEVFTTRADTLYGVSFVAISALHPLAESLCVNTNSKKVFEDLKKEAMLHTHAEELTTKIGVDTGSFAVHPLTGELVAIWIANFVVMDYGTGALMGVPAHDERDFEFAKKYGLPIKKVITPKEHADAKAGKPGISDQTHFDNAYVEPGLLINSSKFSGIDNIEAKEKIAEELESEGKGTRTTQYRLRDWGVSRQRYWGAPIPVIYCESCGVVLVPEHDLPVELPKDVEFSAAGNPLDRVETFKKVKCPQCGKWAKRETDTMDTFVESSWYYARYTDPNNDRVAFDKNIADQWLPVDYYVGGIEHACMHLLYARFFHKVLRDWGSLSKDEPFSTLLSQGMVVKDGAKMSKSKGNVVSPISIIEKFGADTGRLFSLFAAPAEKDLEWNEKGVEGCYRFIQRVWRLCYQFQDSIGPQKIAPEITCPDLLSIRKKTHWAIHKMESDIEDNKFNVAISASMELVNEIYGLVSRNEKAFESQEGQFVINEALSSIVLCMSPFTPHLCEELWGIFRSKSLACEMPFPKANLKLLESDLFLLVVQVNGKVREKIEVQKGLSKEQVQEIVLSNLKVQQFIQNNSIRQFIYIPNRIANVVLD